MMKELEEEWEKAIKDGYDGTFDQWLIKEENIRLIKEENISKSLRMWKNNNPGSTMTLERWKELIYNK